MSRFQASEGTRQYCRVYVHPVDGSTSPRALSWHLAACREPENAEAHCSHGRALLEASADPDGHCTNNGACSRCAMLQLETRSADAGEHRQEVSRNSPIDVIPLASGHSPVEAS